MNKVSQFDRARLRKWSALVVVLVVTAFAVVQVTHVHNGVRGGDDPGSPSTHCLFCVAAHSAPIVTTVTFTPVLALTAAVTPVIDPQLYSQLVIFSAFIRPPPQVL